MKLKIAIMGIRGIPANYGGFETFAEKLSVGLVDKSHEVTVYCRAGNSKYDHEYYKGVRRIALPTLRHKYLDTVAHTLVCVLHSLFRRFDVVLICNSVNSIFSLILRLTGKKVVVNVDGLEWKRAKWNRIAKWVYRTSELLATFLPNHVVTDSRYIQDYYYKKLKKHSTFIPYGAPTLRIHSNEILRKFNLESRKYVLYTSRLEPENNAHLVIDAFEKTKTYVKLVVVGDAPYNKNYIDKLRKTKDPRILFTGYVFGQGYSELQSNAYLYIQATEVGGTHPALLEGMGYGNCILANDVPEHREVLGDTGLYFNSKISGDMVWKLQYLLDHPDEVEVLRAKAKDRAMEKYSWERVISDYECLFLKLARKDS